MFMSVGLRFTIQQAIVAGVDFVVVVLAAVTIPNDSVLCLFQTCVCIAFGRIFEWMQNTWT